MDLYDIEHGGRVNLDDGITPQLLEALNLAVSKHGEEAVRKFLYALDRQPVARVTIEYHSPEPFQWTVKGIEWEDDE